MHQIYHDQRTHPIKTNVFIPVLSLSISTATRRRTPFSRNFLFIGCILLRQNTSVDGMLTTRTFPPWFANSLAAATAKFTSEPIFNQDSVKVCCIFMNNVSTFATFSKSVPSSTVRSCGGQDKGQLVFSLFTADTKLLSFTRICWTGKRWGLESRHQVLKMVRLAHLHQLRLVMSKDIGYRKT